MRASLALALALTPATAHAGHVFVVDAAGGGDFTDIQAAVDAANQQDTVLVHPGTYGGFTVVNKSLQIARDGGQFPRVDGFVSIQALPGGRDVSVSGLHLRQGFEVTGCKASVLFVDCLFVESSLNQDYCGEQPLGLHRVVDCDDVTFTQCNLEGRDGDEHLYCSPDVYWSAGGEPGLYVSGSRTALYECFVQGGDSGLAQDGACGFLQCEAGCGMDGGNGIQAVDNSLVYLDSTLPDGGLGQLFDDCNTQYYSWDADDVSLDGTSVLYQATHPYLHLESASVLRQDELLTVTVVGPETAKAWMVWAPDPHWRFLGVDLGILHLKSNQLTFVPLGKIPAGGLLQKDLSLPNLPPGEEALRMYVQPFALYGGARLLGNVRRVVVLDPAL